MGVNDTAIVRLNYTRNTVDVDEAVKQLQALKTIKAVVMVSTYRAAARFIEKTKDIFPQMIYSNVSFVGSTALSEELKLLGPRYANGVIVTQVVPAVSGYSSIVLEYKTALAKYFPGEAPDYVSLEGYVAANVLIQGIGSGALSGLEEARAVVRRSFPTRVIEPAPKADWNAAYEMYRRRVA